jgi:type II secretory ATPase GspE/PulE/Tfp pilus assembly ATPase PilB-like protein
LHLLNHPGRVLMTIEDPVEYQIPGVAQIEVRPKTGLTSARGLRTILRSDPDVLLVGEIRDEETARIAIQAAMTGHLVLTSLHTHDAASSIERLKDMIMPVRGHLRTLVRASTAVHAGMKTLKQAGHRLVLEGVTSLNEVRRVTGDRLTE